MPVDDWTRVSAGIFHDFHLEWISSIKHALNGGVLPEGYYALAEQVAGGFEPDVLTLEEVSPRQPGVAPAEAGGVALTAMPPKVRYTARAEADVYARKRKRITIRHSSNDRVVGLVEIVSPGNKASAHALRSFVSKASQFLVTGIHLLILDLFPPGPRDPEGLHPLIWGELTGDASFELPDDARLTMASYAAGAVQQAFIEPVAVHGRLAEMPVFIDSERYVPLELEPTYEAAFAAVPERWRAELRDA